MQNMDFTMYETLLQLPLFQGLSKNDITDIFTKVKFHFQKYTAGEYLYKQDDRCCEVCFIISGTVMTETVSRNRTYTFCEVLPTPSVIELYSLFGISPTYQASYRALTETSTLTINKQYLLEQLNNYIPCGFNFSNIICTRGQYLYQRIWSDTIGDLRTRFIQFVLQRSNRPAGQKIIRIKMEDLASLLIDRRINVSRMLNELQNNGLIKLRRKEIEIPAFEELL